MFRNPFLTLKTSKIGFLDSRTGNYFWNLFPNYFREKYFQKISELSKTELFRNSRKQKVWKIPSFAGP